MRYQHTLGRSVSLSGIGLHTGQPTTLTLHPAPVGTGIVFVRQTGGETTTCAASIRNLRPMRLCTAIGSGDMQVQTVEHILSALFGLEIDNAYLELDADEVPASDGSAAPFVRLIQSAGVVQQDHPRAYLKIVQALHVGDERRKLSVEPAPITKITYSIDYDHPLIRQQTYTHHWSAAEFERNIAESRTFAFEKEVESIWSQGLGKGGSLDNTVVFSETGILNELGLRFPDECVRHKILDLIGDFALLGMPIVGHVIADRSGHSLHTELVRTILEHPEAWILLNTKDGKKDTLSKLTARGTAHPQFNPAPAFSAL